MRLIPSASGGRWLPRLLSIVLFALLCAVVAYWAMRLLEPPIRVAPSGTLAGRDTGINTTQAASFFGRADGTASPVTQAIASNFKLFGLIVDAERGAAVISIDGRPAEAFGVGAEVGDSHQLKSVDAQGATLSNGPDEIRLEAPATADIAVLTSGPGPSRAAPGTGITRDGLPLRELPPSGAAAGQIAPAIPPKPDMIRPPGEGNERR